MAKAERADSLVLGQGWERKSPSGQWEELPAEAGFAGDQLFQGRDAVSLRTTFELGASGPRWDEPTLVLGKVDRWLTVSLNGRQILPDRSEKSPWLVPHPSQVVAVPIERAFFRQGANVLELKMVRKYRGGFAQGAPRLMARQDAETLVLREEMPVRSWQMADLAMGCFFFLATLAVFACEVRRRRLALTMVVVQGLGVWASYAFLLRDDPFATHSQSCMAWGELASMLFYPVGLYFFLRYYRQPVRWWMWLTLAILPLSGFSRFLVPDRDGSVMLWLDFLLWGTILGSIVGTFLPLSLVIRRVREGDRWALCWLLLLAATIHLTVRLWSGGFDSLNSEYVFVTLVYVGPWAWRALLFGCGVGLVISRTREAARLAMSSLRAAEKERQRISKDLHDSVTQLLYAAKLQAIQAASGGPKTLENLQKNLDHLTQEMRRICQNLDQESLAGGLAQALAREVEMVDTLVDCKVSVEIEEVALPEGVASQLYQIFHEAVGNAIRHGQAETVQVRLFTEPGKTVLRIEDDGRGFEPTKASGGRGLGLRSMRERAASVGGELLLQSKAGRGTVVEVQVSSRPIKPSRLTTAIPEIETLLPSRR